MPGKKNSSMRNLKLEIDMAGGDVYLLTFDNGMERGALKIVAK